MDLWTALLTVIRRWYISVPILLLGVIATFAAGAQIKPKYTTTSSMILVAPTQVRTPEGLIQPWRNSLMLGSGVRGAGATVVKRLQRTSVANRLESFGYSDVYFVAQTREGDVIEFATEADSAQQAVDTARELMNEAATNLQEIQLVNLQVPEDELIRSEVLTEPDEPEEETGSRPRVMAMVALLSIAAAGAAAILVENLSQRRKAELLAAAPPANGMAGPGYQPLVADGVTYVPVVAAQPATVGAVDTVNGHNGHTAATAQVDDLDRLLDDSDASGQTVAPVRRPAQTLDAGRRNDGRRNDDVDADEQVIDLADDVDETPTDRADAGASPANEPAPPKNPQPSGSAKTQRSTDSIAPPTGTVSGSVRGSINRPRRGSSGGSLFDRGRNNDPS